jgi:hypothetical protein
LSRHDILGADAHRAPSLDPPIAHRNGDGGRTAGDNTEVFDFDGLTKGRD